MKIRTAVSSAPSVAPPGKAEWSARCRGGGRQVVAIVRAPSGAKYAAGLQIVIVLVLLASPLPAEAARACAFEGSIGSKSSAEDTHRGLLYLSRVRAGAHRCFDRVTFEFQAESARSGPGYEVGYEEPPIREDGSGRRAEVGGRAFLVVRLAPARDVRMSGGRPERTYRGPEAMSPPGGRHIVEVRHVSSFEGTVKWAIGLNERRRFRVITLTSPERLVVDVG